MPLELFEWKRAYVGKTTPVKELIVAIRNVEARRRRIDSQLAPILL
jgi:hypothetical protein